VSFPPSPQAPPGAPQGGGDRPGPRTLWKARPDGRTVFRHPGPLLLWWAWVVFALVNIFYLLIGDLTIDAVRGIAGLLTATGVLYACTLHSRVEADDEGVTIHNPLRGHRAPWSAVEAVTLGDSVEFACSRPAPRKAKKVYSWALYSSRRSRARRQVRGTIFPSAGPRGINSRAPMEAADLARQQPSQIMTIELGRRATAGRERNQPGGELRSSVAWLPVAAIGAPAVFLLIAFLVR
jgi:Bacterial PH domain